MARKRLEFRLNAVKMSRNRVKSPVATGEIMTRSAGAIISVKEASVEI